MKPAIVLPFESYEKSVFKLLDRLEGAAILGWNPEEIGHLRTTKQLFS